VIACVCGKSTVRHCHFWTIALFSIAGDAISESEIFFCIKQKCSLLSCYYYDVYVLRLLWRQDSMKCSQADSCVQTWRFSDISGTESVPISDSIPIFTFKDEDRVSLWKTGKPSHLDTHVCPRTFHCTMMFHVMKRKRTFCC